jgi:Protein of unknown function (DUF2637)
MTSNTWRPFGIADPVADAAEANGTTAPPRFVQLRLTGKADKDRAERWLRCAMAALGLLAVAAAIVSFAAQYAMVYRAKHAVPIASLDAGIPDAAALIFAALGIALALHGKRAVRPRLLNLGAVATSIGMNLLAAGGGWRDLAIWVMPPVAYALASDTAIGVIRAHTLAAHRGELAGEDTTPLAVIGGALLWLLRLAVAPVSTLGGLRSWIVEECPVAPDKRGGQRRGDNPQLPAAEPVRVNATPAAEPRAIRGETKTSRFLTLVAERHGELAEIPLADTARIAGEVAPEVELHVGSARRELRNAVLSAQAERRAS